MNDLSHQWGQDLVSGPTGDLASVRGLTRSQQRIIRRLLTAPGTYLWHPSYGAGLGAYIGQTADIETIQAIIIMQLTEETSVVQNPAPTITVNAISNGLFVSIQYIDADSNGQSTPLAFNITG